MLPGADSRQRQGHCVLAYRTRQKLHSPSSSPSATVRDAARRLSPCGCDHPPKTEGLSKVSGGDETVGANSAFELVVFAAKDRVIQTGLPLTVTFDSDITEDIEFSCPSPVLTDSNGEGHVLCMTGDPTDPDSTTVIELDITVTDTEGREVEFTISIDPTVMTGLTSTGLFKISGDGQIVRQGQLFPKPMIVHSLNRFSASGRRTPRCQ